MKKLNLNELSRSVTLREGGKESVSIAQVKEVQRHMLDILSQRQNSETFRIIDGEAFTGLDGVRVGRAWLARAVAAREGGKKSLSIAQVTEVVRLTLEELKLRSASAVLRVLESR